MRGEGSVHIDRSPADVFAFVAEVENNPRWRSYVIETAWIDDGPMRIGRRGRQVSKMLGMRYEVIAKIVEWDPPRRVSWEAFAGGALVRTECSVEPEAGGCRLTIAAEGDFTARIARLFAPLLVATMKRQSRSDTAKLKVALERHAEQEL